MCLKRDDLIAESDKRGLKHLRRHSDSKCHLAQRLLAQQLAFDEMIGMVYCSYEHRHIPDAIRYDEVELEKFMRGLMRRGEAWQL